MASAMVDVNYSGLVFYYLYDKKSKKLLVDESFLKRPWESISVGGSAFGEDGFSIFSARQKYWRFDGGGPNCSFLIQDKISLKCFWNLQQWRDKVLAVEGDVYNYPIEEYIHGTVKTPVARIEEGELLSPLGKHQLRGAMLTMDYSNGILPRQVSWNWASAFNVDAGFNLQQGYFGDHENALWFNNEWHPLGPAIFDIQGDLWKVYSPEGRFELEMKADGLRKENQNLGLVKTQYVQGLGNFEGFVLTKKGERYAVKNLFGVTENHHSLW